MVVRVPVEVKYLDRSQATSALVNSGYEVDEPEIHLPLGFIQRLGIEHEAARSEKYRVVGAEVSTHVLGYVEVRIKLEDKMPGWVKARAVMVPGEYEVIISDALAEELDIIVMKPKKGLWKLYGEERERESVEPQYWIE
jgi:hypothetical protein